MEVPKIELLHIDCMEYMKRVPDKYFELAICDPQYGIGIGHSPRLVTDKGLLAKSWDNEPIHSEFFFQLFRISHNQIIWGGNYYELGITKHCIIWDKRQPEDLSFGMFDFAWTSFDSPNKMFRLHVHHEPDKIHPTQKPVKLYKWLLKNYAKEGDKIFDSHGGSMSIAIACYDLKFDLTLCEIDKDYYDAGVKRFNNHKKQIQLF